MKWGARVLRVRSVSLVCRRAEVGCGPRTDIKLPASVLVATPCTANERSSWSVEVHRCHHAATAVQDGSAGGGGHVDLRKGRKASMRTHASGVHSSLALRGWELASGAGILGRCSVTAGLYRQDCGIAATDQDWVFGDWCARRAARSHS